MNRARFGLPLAGALALLPLLLLWSTLRHMIESRMSLHMLVEFPALFAAGWAAHRLLAVDLRLPQASSKLVLLDWGGLTGASLVTCVGVFWMIPSALDATLLLTPIAAAKYASWWLAGLVLAGSWRRMEPEILLFFVGNLSWMSATAGMLYMDAPARLCANYLLDEQRSTGTGLVLLALALGALALRQVMRLGVPRAATPGTQRPVLKPTKTAR